LVASALLALTSGLLLLAGPPTAQAQPEVTATYPAEGDVLAKPPERIRICFADPVNIRDLGAGGDFGFTVVAPGERSLGLRIVFQVNGLGVDVLPGNSDQPTDGEWIVNWRVTDPDTLEPSEGTIKFTVGPDGSPAPQQLPVTCSLAQPSSPTAQASATPGTGEPADGEDGADGTSDDGIDALVLALIIAGAVGGVAGLGIFLFLIRRRRGSSPPRPPGDWGGG
jgi:methionine-rich copper-binding protein CopC